MRDELRPSEKKTLDQKLRRLRAQIHGNPELSQQEFETTRLVRQCLSALELTPVELGLPTGAAALLRGGYPGPPSDCAPIWTPFRFGRKPVRPVLPGRRA